MFGATGADHVYVEQRGLRVVCGNCGQSMQLKLPCDIDVWLAAATTFGFKHRSCPAPSHPAILDTAAPGWPDVDTLNENPQTRGE